jgi:uncharacterized membrane protein
MRDGAASTPPRRSSAVKMEVPLYKPAEGDRAEMNGSAEPQVSTVLGPLPAGVSLAHTRDLNDAVHRILVIGLVISTALLLTGIILDLVTGRSLPTVTLVPGQAFAAVIALRPSGFLSLGLLVLLVTPIVRVIGSIIVFVWERDWRFALVTSFVLIVMTVSIIVGQE